MKRKPQKLNHNATTDDVAGLCLHLLNIFEEANLFSDPIMGEFATDFAEKTTAINAGINQKQNLSNLAWFDSELEKHIRAFYQFVKGNSFHPQQEKSAAAQLLLKPFNNNGLNFFRKSYDVQESIVNTLIEQFELPESLSAMALLPGSRDLMDKVSAAYNKFESERIAYDKIKAAGKSQKAAYQFREELLELINGFLVGFLQTTNYYNGATYGTLRDTVNVPIAALNADLKARYPKAGVEHVHNTKND